MDPRWKLYAEVFRAWVPIIISVCAICLTVFQAMSTRRHARLSVQPRLDWRIEQDSTAGTIKLSLVNVGFGPALMREVALIVDGDRIPTSGTAACNEIDRRLGRDGDAWDTACITISGEYVLRPGDSVLLYGNRPAPNLANDDHDQDSIDYRRLGAEALYCSFYEECWRLGEE
jgi:hypothetical protein